MTDYDAAYRAYVKRLLEQMRDQRRTDETFFRGHRADIPNEQLTEREIWIQRRQAQYLQQGLGTLRARLAAERDADREFGPEPAKEPTQPDLDQMFGTKSTNSPDRVNTARQQVEEEVSHSLARKGYRVEAFHWRGRDCLHLQVVSIETGERLLLEPLDKEGA